MKLPAIKLAIRRAALLVGLAALVATSGAGAQDIKLPDMGSPADAILTKNVESQIGAMIMRDIRASGQVVEDPLVAEYLNDIGSRIVAQSNDGEHNFTFFAVDDDRINAFALPGGYVGVHTGLVEARHPTSHRASHPCQFASEHPEHGVDAGRDRARRSGRRQ
jgi:predicted Zn-dependent protease